MVNCRINEIYRRLFLRVKEINGKELSKNGKCAVLGSFLPYLYMNLNAYSKRGITYLSE